MDRKATIGFEITTESPTGEKQGHGACMTEVSLAAQEATLKRTISVVM
jgi:hypothetical protein